MYNRQLYFMYRLPLLIFLTCIVLIFSFQCKPAFEPSGRIELLFLGHNSKHHDSEMLAEILSRELFKEGYNISYTNNPADLNTNNLHYYDGLILYANHDSISAEQASALLDYVDKGRGFIPIHSASYCFRNSPEVVELIGGQFKSHTWDSFPLTVTRPDHPVMQNLPAFVTLDETYVHDKLSADITVLSERVEGSHREPYTWVKEHGKGRVFYTAYGHDHNTFNNPGFIQLVKNGIHWAIGDKAAARLAELKLPEVQYSDANIPNYERRDPPPRYQHPLSPEASMLLTQVPVGFELELFAAEPDIINPIYMNWDERGRLWVIETVDYPNTVRDNKEEGDDRIKILEDTDGDGRADKFTIYADKLNIPTSFVFANGGIIVSQAPYFLYFRDDNGDDHADIRDTLISGWGTYDTHAGPSNLRYGPDNRIWGVVGYSGFNGVSGNDSLRFGSGLYTFNRDGSGLEFLSTTSNNTWGLGFSEEFDVFISTANNTHSGFYGIAQKQLRQGGLIESGIEKIDGHYGMHAVTKNLRQVDVHGGFTAAAGHSLYTAREFPAEYWNRVAFINEPTGRVIHKHILEQEGSGFKEKTDGWNILASADEWMGPIQAEVGPDGALWILDWYDFIIQHNPTPEGFENGKGNAYINPLRDHDRGRIYKLKYKGSSAAPVLTLNKEKTSDLIKALSHSNMFWRLTAQRLLVESGRKDVFKDLYPLVKNRRTDEAGTNGGAVHALWTLHGLGAFEAADSRAVEVAADALKHPAAGVRKAALMVLPRSATTLNAITNSGVLTDPDLRVRLTAILSLAEFNQDETLGKTLFELADQQENINDSRIRQALLIATSIHHKGFQDAYSASGLSKEPELGNVSAVQRMALRDRYSLVELERGLSLPVENTPDITGKAFRISGNIEKYQGNPHRGLVMAMGTGSHGAGVYILDNKLHFAVNQEGRKYLLTTVDTLPEKFSYAATLAQDGSMSLDIDGKEQGKISTKGVFNKPLSVGLRATWDNQQGNNRLFSYPESYWLRSPVKDGKLEVLSSAEVPENSRLGKADQVITINVIKDVMKFDKELITVKAGTTVHIVLNNPDFMQHNLVLIRPGTTDAVGAAADRLAISGNGAAVEYVPKMPEVLFATPLINPEGSYTLEIKVPDTPGDYPYLCTFPGHWRIMNGVMRVSR